MKLFLKITLLLFAMQVSLTARAIERDTSYTAFQVWKKNIKKYPSIKIVNSVNDPSLTEFHNLVYAAIPTKNSANRELRLDIIRPNNKKLLPALIMIHGGGWRSGDKSMELPMAQQIALNGYVTIPVEYRLSTEALYPAAVNDIKTAIRWLKVNANQYGIDTLRIAIEGESAGGQLATLVAMTNGIEQFESKYCKLPSTSAVQAVINVDGVVDFLAPLTLNTPQNAESAGPFWLGGVFEDKPLTWKEASPIFWVNEHAVPVLFIASSQPRFQAGRGEMIDLLELNGIYYEKYRFEDSPHSFWLLDPWFRPTVDYCVNFLNKVFK